MSHRPPTVGRARLFAALTALVSMGCAGEGDRAAARDVDLAWLYCDDCRPDDRIALAALGDSAVPALGDQLLGPPPDEVTRARARAAREWARSGRLVDSVRYVAFTASNYQATVQLRSAAVLGDIGTPQAVATLDSALLAHFTGGKQYRSDALEAIEEALLRTGTPLPWGEVVPGVDHTCGTLRSGRTLCWGGNMAGRLGSGPVGGSVASPAEPGGGLLLAEVEPGGDFSCGRSPPGEVYCWGSRALGQLGRGEVDSDPAPVPRLIDGLVARSVVAGRTHTCALDTGGGTLCWGGATRGRLGRPTGVAADPTPVPVAGGPPLRGLTAGDQHTCGLDVASRAWCWGSNGSGQLGDGTFDDRTTPTRVSGWTFTSLSAGRAHTCWSDHVRLGRLLGRGARRADR